MLQELSLFGQVVAADYATVQLQLAALTRMRPQEVLERHLIFKPTQQQQQFSLPDEATGGAGGSGSKQQQEMQRMRQMLNAPLSYVQLVGVAAEQIGEGSEEEGDRQGEGGQTVTGLTGDDSGQPGQMRWSLEFRDIPEAGKMAVTSRTVSRTRVMDGDAVRFVSDLGYQYQSQHILAGHKFYDHDTSTTFFLYRVMQANNDSTTNQNPANPANLDPIDLSGAYILQTSIELQTPTGTSNSTSTDGQQQQQQQSNSQLLKDRATKHLLAIKEMLKESVRLAPAERLALDTRVRPVGYGRR